MNSVTVFLMVWNHLKGKQTYIPDEDLASHLCTTSTVVPIPVSSPTPTPTPYGPGPHGPSPCPYYPGHPSCYPHSCPSLQACRCWIPSDRVRPIPRIPPSRPCCPSTTGLFLDPWRPDCSYWGGSGTGHHYHNLERNKSSKLLLYKYHLINVPTPSTFVSRKLMNGG